MRVFSVYRCLVAVQLLWICTASEICTSSEGAQTCGRSESVGTDTRMIQLVTEGKEAVQPSASEESVAEASTSQPCGFWDFFSKHTSGPGIEKWNHYFPVYEEHFGRYCGSDGRPTRMMEIGIQSGGSMLMWRHGFGENLQLEVGVDINPATSAWEQFGSNVKVEIGSQADPEFLDGLKRKYADGFDIILDDGSHMPDHIITSFARMWSSIRPGGVYMIEDLHGTNPVLHWLLHGHETSGGKVPGMVYPDEGIGEGDRLQQGGGDGLNFWTGGKTKASKMQEEVESIKVYPYMVAITKRQATMGQVTSGKVGDQWIPYKVPGQKLT